ncbi:hypothetical protein I6G82_21075 [Lysinibacillus macroides]|uniref:Uncharacterized protein n=1 Tax=Lysinibacillus macroides TaxID=33935 RepID=A0A0M9DGF2_9BACI|nr:hypothetical protein [Lysinibacillus macroides]KOY80349.1 hypothetical protein ADM90_21160 [Lysinibacillus macroides]QPR67659.1 hypothetical protein I6G82_21075 [Lysinibacillus macroides]
MSDVQKHAIHQLIKEQLNRRNGQDNSFAFLEKNTLNLLIAYLISGETTSNEQPVLETKLIQQLDKILVDSKAQFEEVIHLLKSYSG